MQGNYQKLLNQLIELIRDQNVQDNLGINLRNRVQRLIKSKLTSKKPQKKTQSSIPNYIRNKQTDLCQKFSNIVLNEIDLQERSNRKRNNLIGETKSSKQNTLKRKFSKQKERQNSNDRYVLREKSSQKILSKYHTNQNSLQKLKNQRISKQSDLERSNIKKMLQTKDRSNSKLRVTNLSKDNTKIYYTKPSKKHFANLKTQLSESDYSQIIFTKNQSQSFLNKNSKSTIKKLAGINTNSSRLSKSSNKKYSLSLQKQKRFLFTIQQKKQQIIEQKLVLQDSIRMLQQKICKQKKYLNETEMRVANIYQYFNKAQSYQKERYFDQKLSRKKSTSYCFEAKQLEQQIIEVSKNNQQIIDAIKEEKYFVKMYQKVIEEIKSQLRVQKEEKADLKKKLIQLKNNLIMVNEKYILREAVSDQLFNSMQIIIKKWN